MINKLNFSLFKKIPVVLQTEAAECGLACLAMPMNYETLIGELGNNLSGGQRQRLFIARALYKNRKYYLWTKRPAI